jgi:hypothetical protein
MTSVDLYHQIMSEIKKYEDSVTQHLSYLYMHVHSKDNARDIELIDAKLIAIGYCKNQIDHVFRNLVLGRKYIDDTVPNHNYDMAGPNKDRTFVTRIVYSKIEEIKQLGDGLDLSG